MVYTVLNEKFVSSFQSRLKKAYIKKYLWRILIYGCITYNFHRYIFKYSHGAYPKEGYQQTPLTWQAGKFGFVLIILSVIYLNSRFTNKLPSKLLAIYSFLSLIFLYNAISIVIYKEIMTDEIEYLLFAFMLLPVCFFESKELSIIRDEIVQILNYSQYIVLISNWVVIANYYINNVIPFHAYEGILMRFGGLWDDPNTLSIISCFFLGFSFLKKKYLLSVLHIINILLAISFNGYLLMSATVVYFVVNSDFRTNVRALILILLICILSFFIYISIDLIIPIYEAKSESVEQHSEVNLKFGWIPINNSLQFHETWWISAFVNYFPASIILIAVCFWVFVKIYFVKKKSLQNIMFILFFISNVFLPFLYMFPINFIALLFLVLYFKGVVF